jgi:hypothetical protein
VQKQSDSADYFLLLVTLPTGKQVQISGPRDREKDRSLFFQIDVTVGDEHQAIVSKLFKDELED